MSNVAELVNQTESVSSQAISDIGSDCHIFLILIVLIICGSFGGFINSFLQYDGDFNSSTDHSKNIIYLPRSHCIWAGIAAALLVPLFLETISSNLILEVQKNHFKYFQMGGFALLAGIVSRAFIKSISDRLVLEKSKIASKDAKYASEIANNAKDIAEKITAELKKTQKEFINDINISERRTAMLIDPIVLFDQGKLQEALNKLNELMTEHDILQKYDEAWEWKGYFLKRLSRFSEAAEALEKALSLSNKTSWSMFYNAACYKTLAKYEKTDILKDLRKALELNRDRTLKALQNEPDFCLINKSSDFQELLLEFTDGD